MRAFQRTHCWTPRMTLSDSKSCPVPHCWRQRLIMSIHRGRYLCYESRLIQRARRARAQGPQASGGPQTAYALFF